MYIEYCPGSFTSYLESIKDSFWESIRGMIGAVQGYALISNDALVVECSLQKGSAGTGPGAFLT